MSQEELTQEERALLETQFPEYIEKIASANIATMDAMTALREYGEARAEAELFEAAGDEEGYNEALEKQAFAADLIDSSLKQIRAHNYEQESQMDREEFSDTLVKEASAAGQMISDAYFSVYDWATEEVPELVKEAAKKKLGLMAAIGDKLKAGGKHVTDWHNKGIEELKHLGKGQREADARAIKRSVSGMPKEIKEDAMKGLSSQAAKARLMTAAKGAGRLAAAPAAAGAAGYGGYKALKKED